MSNASASRNLWFALILIAVGALFLLDNLNLYDFHLPWWVFSWKTILILIGAAMLGSGRKSGLVLLIIGGAFLLPDIFDFIPRLYLRTWWPLILILLGIVILVRRSGSADRRQYSSDPSESETLGISKDYLDEVSILGGSNQHISSESFKGGKVTSILGGNEIDFRNSKLAAGTHIIDVVTIFGGSTFIVPEDWDIKLDVNSILGGVGDKRSSIPEGDGNSLLIIKGIAMFGGLEIKNA